MSDHYNEFVDWIDPRMKEKKSEAEAKPAVEEESTEKGGPGSGNFGHQGIPGHWGGSQPKKGKIARGVGIMPNTRPEPGHVRVGNEGPVREGSSRNLVARMMGGGFTYSTVTGRHQTSGLSVSVYPENEEVHSPEEFQKNGARIVAEYWRKNIKTLSKPHVFMGGWYDRDTNRIVLDCSVVVKSRKEAELLSRKYKQEAYFDLATFETIHVEGSRPGWENETPSWMNTLKELDWMKEAMAKSKKATKQIAHVVMEDTGGEMPSEEQIKAFLKALMGDDYNPDQDTSIIGGEAEEPVDSVG
jgi:hypothetical protein